jgi:hypothetical protein
MEAVLAAVGGVHERFRIRRDRVALDPCSIEAGRNVVLGAAGAHACAAADALRRVDQVHPAVLRPIVADGLHAVRVVGEDQADHPERRGRPAGDRGRALQEIPARRRQRAFDVFLIGMTTLPRGSLKGL